MHLYAKIQKSAQISNAYADMHLHIIRCLVIAIYSQLQKRYKGSKALRHGILKFQKLIKKITKFNFYSPQVFMVAISNLLHACSNTYNTKTSID